MYLQGGSKMNYSKIRKSDLADLVTFGEGCFYFQGKQISEEYTDKGIRYRYEDRRWNDENDFRTLLKAVKAYRKLFR